MLSWRTTAGPQLRSACSSSLSRPARSPLHCGRIDFPRRAVVKWLVTTIDTGEAFVPRRRSGIFFNCGLVYSFSTSLLALVATLIQGIKYRSRDQDGVPVSRQFASRRPNLSVSLALWTILSQYRKWRRISAPGWRNDLPLLDEDGLSNDESCEPYADYSAWIAANRPAASKR